MTDYWDHPEYGELEKELEAQKQTTRNWMALHDEAVEREHTQTTEGGALRDLIHGVGAILDSNLPLDRKKLAGTIAEGLIEVERVSDSLAPGKDDE